jgi:hypothetical protein
MRESLMGEMPGEARYDENAMEVADALGWLNLQTDAIPSKRIPRQVHDPRPQSRRLTSRVTLVKMKTATMMTRDTSQVLCSSTRWLHTK